METAVSAGTPEGLIIVLELAPNNLPAPIIPKPAAPEALRKSRLDQLRPSVFTARDPDISLLLIATIELFPVPVCWVGYSCFLFLCFLGPQPPERSRTLTETEE